MSTPVKPDITPYLEAIENAVYGEEVRGSIHDAIEAVNDYADEFYTDAQEQAQAAANSASSASGYATTASTKAGEASASATAAGNAETAAKNAKTDAVDAKNLANEYAGNAASSAAQAAASAQAAAAAGPILVDTVGWMCKNRVPLTLETLKALNTLGTWADNVYTRNDVDFTVNTNSDGYVTSIVMNGTASGFASLTLLDDTISNLSEFLPVGDYIVNGCPDGGGTLSGFSMRFKVDADTYIITDSTDMSVDVSGSLSDVISWSISCTSGTSVSSKTFKPMIRKAAIIDNSFEPYHKSVEDWYWENNAKTGVHNLWDDSVLSSKFEGNTVGGSYTYNASTHEYTINTTTHDWSGIQLSPQNFLNFFGKFSGYSGRIVCEAKADANMSARILNNVADSNVNLTTNYQTFEREISDFGVLPTEYIVFYTRSTDSAHTITVKNIRVIFSEDTDNDFSDYAMTNAELTDNVFKKRTLSSSDNLNDITEPGIYGISTSPINMPENQTYCTMLVNTNAGGGVNQIIFRNNPTEAFIYERRYGGEPLSWSSWFKFTGTIVT